MASISPERRAALEKEKQKNASGAAANFFSMKDMNKAIIRLTPVPEAEDIGKKVVTYFIGNRGYICNEAVHGKPGVIARAIRCLAKLADNAEAQEVREALESNRRTTYVLKILVLNNDDHVTIEKGPCWFRAPRTIYEAIFKVFMDDGEDLSHRTEGCPIRISKSGSGLQTEYSIRVLSSAPMHEDKAERQRIVAEAAELDVDDLLRPDEAGALEALSTTVPRDVWKLIRAKVTEGVNLEDDKDDAATGKKAAAGDDDAPPKKAAKDDEDETPPKKKAAAPADDEDEPPKKKAAAPADDDDAPPPKKKAAPADDEDAPPPKKKAPVADDEDAPPPKKKAAPADDEDTPPPKKKAEVTADDEDAPPPKKKAAPPADDDDDAPPAPKKKTKYSDE